ncbi:hypothetical protein FHX80_112615 [Streptomyces brevispora]|uniref:Uncharacterized protein n=1 Tax=Streptomyces brevispora TaxID=887462 RepID=A0A561UXU2_9ACTN|nr:hypothetical protein FHX80_112615 [Streptomyces brevispora]
MSWIFSFNRNISLSRNQLPTGTASGNLPYETSRMDKKLLNLVA